MRRIRTKHGKLYSYKQYGESNRLKREIRDYISKNGGTGQDYYVGIAQSRTHFEGRIRDHIGKYKITTVPLPITSKFPRVTKDVEDYFTDKAQQSPETKHEHTQGKTGGCERPSIIYIFKIGNAEDDGLTIDDLLR